MQSITSSQDAYILLKSLSRKSVEEFWVLALTSEKTLIKRKCLFRGTVDACLIHPRDLFRFGCQTNASSLVIAHNHPNASPVPSESDLKLTSRLVEAGNLMQIPVVDHLILSRHSYLSFRDLGWIETGKRNQSFFHGYK